MGYAVFVPIRRGHNGNPGPVWEALVLAGGRQADFRAGISFAGPSITWPDAPALQDVLIESMRRTEIPLCLIQAWDDVHLTPTYVLGGELAALEQQHETRVYQPLGTERGNGHGVFNKGVELWSADVRRFPSALGVGRRCTLRAVITESGVDV